MTSTADKADAVDFDLHGFVGIRLIAPAAADVATVVRQIGPLQSPLSRDPDIVVRFVDRLPDNQRVTYVDWPGSGWTEDRFYLLRGRHGIPARTRVDLSTAGVGCEMTCERRGGPVPHLLALINLAAVANGVLPLHASAFDYHGRGVLATGWAKGGKTEVLLAFAAKGARYIGDEWVYVTRDGEMYGVPEPIRLWYWHVRQLREIEKALSRGARARLATLPRLSAAAELVAGRLSTGSGLGSLLRRAAPVVRRQATVQVSPFTLFGSDGVVPHGQLDTVLFVTSHDRPEVVVEPVDSSVVGRRMVSSLAEERVAFLASYHQYRFAFPDRRSDVVETITAREADLVSRVFEGRRCFQLSHPYPMRLGDLVGPVEAVLDRG